MSVDRLIYSLSTQAGEAVAYRRFMREETMDLLTKFLYKDNQRSGKKIIGEAFDEIERTVTDLMKLSMLPPAPPLPPELREKTKLPEKMPKDAFVKPSPMKTAGDGNIIQNRKSMFPPILAVAAPSTYGVRGADDDEVTFDGEDVLDSVEAVEAFFQSIVNFEQKALKARPDPTLYETTEESLCRDFMLSHMNIFRSNLMTQSMHQERVFKEIWSAIHGPEGVTPADAMTELESGTRDRTFEAPEALWSKPTMLEALDNNIPWAADRIEFYQRAEARNISLTEPATELRPINSLSGLWTQNLKEHLPTLVTALGQCELLSQLEKVPDEEKKDPYINLRFRAYDVRGHLGITSTTLACAALNKIPWIVEKEYVNNKEVTAGMLSAYARDIMKGWHRDLGDIDFVLLDSRQTQWANKNLRIKSGPMYPALLDAKTNIETAKGQMYMHGLFNSLQVDGLHLTRENRVLGPVKTQEPDSVNASDRALIEWFDGRISAAFEKAKSPDLVKYLQTLLPDNKSKERDLWKGLHRMFIYQPWASVIGTRYASLAIDSEKLGADIEVVNEMMSTIGTYMATLLAVAGLDSTRTGATHEKSTNPEFQGLSQTLQARFEQTLPPSMMTLFNAIQAVVAQGTNGVTSMKLSSLGPYPRQTVRDDYCLTVDVGHLLCQLGVIRRILQLAVIDRADYVSFLNEQAGNQPPTQESWTSYIWNKVKAAPVALVKLITDPFRSRKTDTEMAKFAVIVYRQLSHSLDIGAASYLDLLTVSGVPYTMHEASTWIKLCSLSDGVPPKTLVELRKAASSLSLFSVPWPENAKQVVELYLHHQEELLKKKHKYRARIYELLETAKKLVEEGAETSNVSPLAYFVRYNVGPILYALLHVLHEINQV